MARQNYWESDFISGELSPRINARTDFQKYGSGVSDLTNFIIQLQGGIAKRSGTVYVAPIKTQADKSILIPFTAGDSTAYIIEAGNEYFRFYTDQGQLVVSSTPVEISTPYLTAELFELDFAQSADTLFIVHPNHPPMQLQRTSSTTFVLSAFPFQDGPYITENQVTTALLEHSGFTRYDYYDPADTDGIYQYNGSGTITASGTNADGSDFAPFASTDVGRWIRILQGNIWGAVQITAFTDSKHVTGTVLPSCALGDSGSTSITINGTTYTEWTIYPTFTWRFGSWSDTTGYPSAIVFYQGRLCFANTPTEPQGFWASESGIFNLFAPTENDATVEDSDGLGYTVDSNNLNSIQWLLPAQALLMGTYGAEWAVLSSSSGAPLTPSNVSFQQQTSFGSKKIRPFLIGVSTLYVQRSGQKLREMTYDWSINGWRSIEISMLSEHLLREGGGITQAAYQQEPSNIWWGCREDGVLVGMTYIKEQEILGFHKHIIGGSFGSGNAVVESICCIPTPDGTQDQLWMIVKRTVNGDTVRYVEYMDVAFDATVAGKNTMNFVDAGVQSAGFPVPLGSPVTSVSGLSHLVGQTVAVCGDGSVQPNEIVADDGTIPLQSPLSLLTVGLPYMAQMTTLELPVQGDFGTSQGVVKRIDRLIFRLLDTLTFKYGKDYNNLAYTIFGTTTTLMDGSPLLFTGDKDVFFASQYDKSAKIAIQSDEPYPCNLLGMSPQLVVQPK